MSKTKTLGVSFSLEDIKQLEYLQNKFGENRSQVVKRAIYYFYLQEINREKENKEQ